MPLNEHAPDKPWETELRGRLPLWGHRNWIVVADSAYPAQANPGIETIATGDDHLNILAKTLSEIGNNQHLRAKIYLDSELDLVTDMQAPGVSDFRRDLSDLVRDLESATLPHEQIIAKLDESAQVFRILVLKSTLAIPYTSVFLELDCGYWTAESEEELREAEIAHGLGTMGLLKKRAQ